MWGTRGPGVLGAAKGLGLGAIITLASCDWFGLRDPTPPSGPSYWQQPTSPSIVIDNIRNALTYFTADNYISSLNEFYEFYPDPSLEGDIYKNWNRATEDSVIRNLMAQLDFGQELPIQATITITDSTTSPTSYQYSISYEITVFMASGEILFCRGTGSLNVIKNADTQLWDVLTWQDFKGDTASWAEIKARFR